MGQEGTVNFLRGCKESVLSPSPALARMFAHCAPSSGLPGVSYAKIAEECCRNQSGGHAAKLIPTVCSEQQLNFARRVIIF